jgi:hypothetical protein
MDPERRKFLRGMAAACAAGVANNLKVAAGLVNGGTVGAGTAAATSATATAATAATVSAGVAVTAGAYSVRAKVFEVIVRQAIAGAPWRDICAGPMQVNGIDPEDVQREVDRQPYTLHDMSKKTCYCDDCIKKRLEHLREVKLNWEKKLAAIPHSELSPCHCKACFEKVQEMRGAMLTNESDFWC